MLSMAVFLLPLTYRIWKCFQFVLFRSALTACLMRSCASPSFFLSGYENSSLITFSLTRISK